MTELCDRAGSDAIELGKNSTTNDGLQLIKGKFGIEHGFEDVVEVFSSDAHTISRLK